MNLESGSRRCTEVLDLIDGSVVAERTFFEEVLVGLLSGGHVLIEDVPGTGKTLTARSFAQALGLEFNRIQFTPDLLPADVTGTTIYDQEDVSFDFNRGPLFANVVLADEINRAPPKTQAALLEAMEEQQVTADGVTYDLPEPFFVIATQNPVEQEGTFQLPEAQVDRFIIKTSIGYPGRDGEMELLDRRGERTTQAPSLSSNLTPESITDLCDLPEQISVSTDVKEYMIEIVQRTRGYDHVELGVSPRGLQRLFEAVRARAVIEGREYVVPDDVKALAKPVLAHRLVLTTESKIRSMEKRDIVAEILDDVEVPSGSGGAQARSSP
jgi:MoxR-like ATPase